MSSALSRPLRQSVAYSDDRPTPRAKATLYETRPNRTAPGVNQVLNAATPGCHHLGNERRVRPNTSPEAKQALTATKMIATVCHPSAAFQRVARNLAPKATAIAATNRSQSDSVGNAAVTPPAIRPRARAARSVGAGGRVITDNTTVTTTMKPIRMLLLRGPNRIPLSDFIDLNGPFRPDLAATRSYPVYHERYLLQFGYC